MSEEVKFLYSSLKKRQWYEDDLHYDSTTKYILNLLKQTIYHYKIIILRYNLNLNNIKQFIEDADWQMVKKYKKKMNLIIYAFLIYEVLEMIYRIKNYALYIKLDRINRQRTAHSLT